MNRRDLTKAQTQALRWLAGEARGNTATRHVMNRLAELGYIEGPPGQRALTELGKEHLARLHRPPSG